MTHLSSIFYSLLFLFSFAFTFYLWTYLDIIRIYFYVLYSAQLWVHLAKSDCLLSWFLLSMKSITRSFYQNHTFKIFNIIKYLIFSFYYLSSILISLWFNLCIYIYSLYWECSCDVGCFPITIALLSKW